MRLFNKKKKDKMDKAINSPEVTVVECDCLRLTYKAYVVYGRGMYFVVAGIFGGAVAFQLASSSGNRKLPKSIAIETKSRNLMDTLGRNALALACKILTYSWLTNGIWPEHSFSDCDTPALSTATINNLFKSVTATLQDKNICRMSVLFKCSWVNDAIVMTCSGSTGIALCDNDMAFYSTDGYDDFYVRDDLNQMDIILGLFDHLHESLQWGSAITDSDFKERLLRRKQILLRGRELVVEWINDAENHVAFIKGDDEEYYVSDTTDGIILSIGSGRFRMRGEYFRDVVICCVLKSLQGESVISLFNEVYFGWDVACSLDNPADRMTFRLQPNGELLFSYGANEYTFLLSRLDAEYVSVRELSTSRRGIYDGMPLPSCVNKDAALLFHAIELCLRIESNTISMDTLEEARAERIASHVF